MLEKILKDHEKRKDALGVTWFSEEDLQRLGIDTPLHSVMQDLQHLIKLRKLLYTIQTGGYLDRWNLQDVATDDTL